MGDEKANKRRRREKDAEEVSTYKGGAAKDGRGKDAIRVSEQAKSWTTYSDSFEAGYILSAVIPGRCCAWFRRREKIRLCGVVVITFRLQAVSPLPTR